MASRGTTPVRQPELILASEADKRAATANGPRETTAEQPEARVPSANQRSGRLAGSNQPDGLPGSSPPISATKTPDNTPRNHDHFPRKEAGDVETLVASTPTGESDGPEKVLDDDEMFMNLTNEERQEWEAMMKERSHQLDTSKEQHQTWVDSFTRRRMFVYSRMRKLQENYSSRAQFFTQMAATVSRTQRSRAHTSLPGHSKKIEKRLSEPQLRGGRLQSQKIIQTNRSPNPNDAITEIPVVNQISPITSNEAADVKAGMPDPQTDRSQRIGLSESMSKPEITINKTGTVKYEENDKETDILHQDRANTPFVKVEQVSSTV